MENSYVYKSQKSRFYILFTFSFYTFVFGFILNSWEPIMIPFQQIYKWNLTEINMLINVNTIVFCLLIVPFVLFWNKFGMRLSYYVSLSCVLIGCFIRLYPGSIHVQSTVILVGNSISALGNLISAIGCTEISAVWFPSVERVRATTSALSFAALGSAMAPVVVSYMVPNSKNTSGFDVTVIRRNIDNLMFTHAALALVSLILVLLYFPSKPSVLPCKSSNRELRIDLVSGCKELIRNGQFWAVFGTNLICAGVSAGMFGVITSIILPLGISQEDAALIKSVSTFFMFVAALLIGWLGDRFGCKMVVCLTLPPSFIMSVIFGLQTTGVIGHSLASIYAVTSVLSFSIMAVGPLSYEMGCEAAFPVREEVSSAIIGIATNIGAMVFLFITMIPNIGTRWIPFFYTACLVLVVPLMCVYKDSRKRLRCDTSEVAGDSRLVDENTLLINAANG